MGCSQNYQEVIAILSSPAGDNFTAAVVGGIKPFLFCFADNT